MKTIIDKEKFGEWAIVTGASSGIGEEFAHQLAELGFNLILASRRKAKLDELGSYLAKKHNISYKSVQVDLTQNKAYVKIIDAAKGLDIGLLISNAGTGRPGSFLNTAFEQLLEIVQLNALSHLALTHHFGKSMKQNGRGGILLTGAMGAINGIPYMANESGTKSFVQGLGKALNAELRTTGIHVTVLVTSPTDTPIMPELGFTKDAMPMKALTVNQCVKEALVALRDNKMTVIPGFKFRLMNAAVPSKLSRTMMGDMLRKNNNISIV